MTPDNLLALANRVDTVMGSDNALDVLIEIALFEPDPPHSVSVRANSAGTKVVYTSADGRDETCWAYDWTTEEMRSMTTARLRALAQVQP